MGKKVSLRTRLLVRPSSQLHHVYGCSVQQTSRISDAGTLMLWQLWAQGGKLCTAALAYRAAGARQDS